MTRRKFSSQSQNEETKKEKVKTRKEAKIKRKRNGIRKKNNSPRRPRNSLRVNTTSLPPLHPLDRNPSEAPCCVFPPWPYLFPTCASRCRGTPLPLPSPSLPFFTPWSSLRKRELMSRLLIVFIVFLPLLLPPSPHFLFHSREKFVQE